MLFDVTPGDPSTLALAAFVLIAVAIAASFLPAVRAARLDALRAE
jgi:ABC-type antimicrobial peptide transport system permease subunit